MYPVLPLTRCTPSATEERRERKTMRLAVWIVCLTVSLCRRVSCRSRTLAARLGFRKGEKEPGEKNEQEKKTLKALSVRFFFGCSRRAAAARPTNCFAHFQPPRTSSPSLSPFPFYEKSGSRTLPAAQINFLLLLPPKTRLTQKQ